MKKKKKIFQGALSTILIITGFVMVLSFVLSLFDFQSYETYISNGILESSLVTVNNIFSEDGFNYLFNNSIINFRLFEPLVLLIVSLIGIGIADASGMLDSIFIRFKQIKGSFLTFFIILISICITFFGNYSYVMLFPFIGLLYKKIGRNPILGILTVFLGVTLGYGTGIMFNYDSYILGSLTEAAATVEVDKDYVFSLVSTEYIMVITTFLISFILTSLIEKRVVPNYKKVSCSIDDSNKFSFPTLILFFVLMILLVYMIVPGLPFSGFLLDNSALRYIDKLFGASSPFSNGFICIFSLILSLCGIFYGRLNGKKESSIYTNGFIKIFDGLGYLFVLMFFISQLQGIIDYTNIGVVISCKLIDLISNLQLSGVFLIVIFFLVVVIMSIFIPSTTSKWIIASPVVVPLFMRSNITPDFTQFIFQIADSVGKGLTPIYAYFIIMIGFMQKYASEDDSITILGTMRLTLPITLIIGFVWLVILALWFISGIPIGINGVSTL